MRVFIKGLNSCGQRVMDILSYRQFVADCGHELTDDPSRADMLLIWTCAFRYDVLDRSMDILNGYVDLYGADKVVACGCMPAIDESALRERFSGRWFAWSQDNAALRDLLDTPADPEGSRVYHQDNLTTDIERFRRENPGRYVSYYDQFIKLYACRGCLYDCAYCAEKLAFPCFMSFPLDTILNSCREAMRRTGCTKIALYADSIGNYGQDTGSSFAELVRAILALGPNVSIGLVNLNPLDFIRNSELLLDVMAQGKMFTLVLPIQSADDRVLASMGRPYTAAELERAFADISRLEYAGLESHLIAGFPGETREEFRRSVDFLVRYKPKYVSVNGYADFGPLASSRLPGKVPHGEIAERITEAVDALKARGVIVNYDGCEFVRDYLRKNRPDGGTTQEAP